MSRPRRRTPLCGITTAESEKNAKRVANRTLRRRVRAALHGHPDAPLPLLREVSDPWLMDKDGKMLIDPARHPKIMRKQARTRRLDDEKPPSHRLRRLPCPGPAGYIPVPSSVSISPAPA